MTAPRVRHAGALAAVAAVAMAAGVLSGCTTNRVAVSPPPSPSTRSSASSDPAGNGQGGPRPVARLLSAYRGCDDLLAGLRKHAAANAKLWAGDGVVYDVRAGAAPAEAGQKMSAVASAPDHSTTNTQEQGVDEPDRVETDGRRVITVADGMLRVVDTASRRVTGTLDLSMYVGADDAQLLLHGDRLLVLMGASSYSAIQAVAADVAYPAVSGSTTAIVVDLRAAPTIVSTFHAPGGTVSVRAVNGVAHLVVRSTPTFAFPKLSWTVKPEQRRAAYRTVIERAPLRAWLPTYTVSAGGRSEQHTVPCSAVRHPDDYTGASLLSVYSVDVTASSPRLDPVALAADGTTAYQDAGSLFIASSNGAHTELHRFDVTTRRPAYLGSANVPGFVADSYSMSAYDGSLRVVTTTTRDGSDSASAVYVLDAQTLRPLGHVGGLGRGEQLHGVRFLGPLAYVVTFESVDPLYVVDLHDPAHPRTVGDLTITGYSDYLHPTSTGRLLGIGQSVRKNENGDALVNGLQISLFDISKPGRPTRIDRLTRQHTPSETEIDPHAFLYWPKTGTAIVPIDSWNANESGAALVVRVSRNSLQTVGTIRNPAGTSASDTGIVRSLVVGDSIWTLSAGGLAVSDLTTLHRQAWIAF